MRSGSMSVSMQEHCGLTGLKAAIARCKELIETKHLSKIVNAYVMTNDQEGLGSRDTELCNNKPLQEK